MWCQTICQAILSSFTFKLPKFNFWYPDHEEFWTFFLERKFLLWFWAEFMVPVGYKPIRLLETFFWQNFWQEKALVGWIASVIVAFTQPCAANKCAQCQACYERSWIRYPLVSSVGLKATSLTVGGFLSMIPVILSLAKDSSCLTLASAKRVLKNFWGLILYPEMAIFLLCTDLGSLIGHFWGCSTVKK